MSFSALSYDPCAYDKSLQESLAVGKYMLDTTLRPSDTFVSSPHVRAQSTGVARCKTRPLVDVDSELMGLNRAASKCPDAQFSQDYCQVDTLPSEAEIDLLSAEDTLLSNPPCTLRGTGWNRWEWLCTDPQKRALMPFETNVQNKLIVRDNHRPCVSTPEDQHNVVPNGADPTCYTDIERAWKPIDDKDTPPMLHWRPCCEIKHL